MGPLLQYQSRQNSENGNTPEDALTLREARAQFERDFITRALERHGGRVAEAAKSLGIQRTNLYRKVRQLKLPKSLLSKGH